VEDVVDEIEAGEAVALVDEDGESGRDSRIDSSSTHRWGSTTLPLLMPPKNRCSISSWARANSLIDRCCCLDTCRTATTLAAIRTLQHVVELLLLCKPQGSAWYDEALYAPPPRP
jgi:hypothetical protein